MLRKTTILFLLVILPVATARAGVAPTLVDPLRAERAILIPAAGNVEGANDTHFRSDIQLTNLRVDSAQRVQLHWLPSGGSAEPFVRVVEIAPLAAISSEDFVTNILGQTGLGSIVIVGINDEDQPDPLAELHAVSRIWTPQPGTNGTTSQSFSPVSLRATDERRLTVFGQRQDERYRTNVGLVNADPDAPHDYEIVISGFTADGEAWGPETINVTLPAWSMTQLPLSDVPALATLQIDAAPVLLDDETPRPWIMYGSSVDNITGDAWSNTGFSTFEPLEPTRP